jgi:pimeloyl-ACP methyl ester carboxylesterase
MADRSTLLLVHGFPLDSRMWQEQVEALSGSMYVLAPDLAGHGPDPSGTAGSSVDDIARFLAARLDEAGVDAAHLAGFSMGGYASFAFLRLFPRRVLSLALVDTRANADNDPGRQGRDALIARIKAEGPGVAAEAMLPKMFTDAVDPELRATAQGWMLEQPANTLVADLTAMRDRPDSTSMLAQVSVPTLVIVGDQDPITPPADSQAMADAIPGAHLVTIEGASHLAPVEQPQQVSEALNEFLGG